MPPCSKWTSKSKSDFPNKTRRIKTFEARSFNMLRKPLHILLLCHNALVVRGIFLIYKPLVHLENPSFHEWYYQTIHQYLYNFIFIFGHVKQRHFEQNHITFRPVLLIVYAYGEHVLHRHTSQSNRRR